MVLISSFATRSLRFHSRTLLDGCIVARNLLSRASAQPWLQNSLDSVPNMDKYKIHSPANEMSSQTAVFRRSHDTIALSK